jgi:hypothetical protein
MRVGALRGVFFVGDFMSVTKRKAAMIQLFLGFVVWGFIALAGVSGAFLGLPLPGTLRMASKSFSVYKASCEKGFMPFLKSRLLTVSLGSFNLSAISEIVIPFIPHIIGSLMEKSKNVHEKELLLYRSLDEFGKNVKKLFFFANIIIDNMFFYTDNISMG